MIENKKKYWRIKEMKKLKVFLILSMLIIMMLPFGVADQHSPSTDYPLCEIEDSLLPVLISQSSTPEEAVAFSKDNVYMAFGGHSERLHIYTVSTWSALTTIMQFNGTIRSIDFSYDNQYMAFLTADGYIFVYNVGTWNLETTISDANRYAMKDLSFSPDGNYLAYITVNYVGASYYKVYIRDVGGAWGKVTELAEVANGISIYDLDWSDDDTYIAYGASDDIVYIHWTATWGKIKELTESSETVNNVAFSNNSEYIAYSSSISGTIYVHDMGTWAKVAELTDSTLTVSDIDFSNNGKWLASGSYDDVVYVYNTSNWELSAEFGTGTPSSNVRAVAFSNNSAFLAYADTEDYIHVKAVFDCTRTAGVSSEKNVLSFTPTYNFTTNVNLKVAVSSETSGIINVTNNTCGTLATEVNTSSDLVNNTFWYDSANQFVYIRTINLTTSTPVNWTVNCTYGMNFNLIIPPYLTVGQYFHSEGFISDDDGYAISGVIAETRLLYPNGTDALPVNPKHNCTGGNYACTFSTAVLPPGVYSVSIEFTDPDTGIVFKEGGTLYLSFDTPDGVYSDAIVYFSFYNTNVGLGLIPETFKVYIDDVRNYNNQHYGYTGETINITIKDYYNFSMYSANYTIVATYTGLNFGLTFHEYDFTNQNSEYYYASFLKDGADRWFEKVVASSGGQKSFMLPTGNYTVRVYNADNSSYTSWTETINRSKAYLIGTDGVSLIIQGQSVIIGEFLELNADLDYVFMPDAYVYSRNPPIIFSAFDRIGMMLGQNYYSICPPINVIAQTRYEETGNWINNTALIPSNGTTENGSITVLEDIIYFNIVDGNAPTWVNITYTSNGTLIQNTTYIPSRFYPETYNVTINASTDIHITRETRFNQLKMFYWDIYPGTDNPGWLYEGGQKRVGYHEAGLEVENTMSVIWYDVYVYAGYTPEKEIDLSTVRVTDVDNGNMILDEGEHFRAGGSGLDFRLTGSMTAGETRSFIAECYESYSDQYYYGSEVIHIDSYQTNKRMNEKLYNYFKVTWINTNSKTYRGTLEFYFDFEVKTGIKQNDIIVYDAGTQTNITDFIIGDSFLKIGSEAVGDVNPGGGKTYEVYFKFDTYPGQNLDETHMNTPMFNFAGIPISIFVVLIMIFLFMAVFGALLFLFSKQKKTKDHGKALVLVGILVTFLTWLLTAVGL